MNNFTYKSKYGTYEECFFNTSMYMDGNHRLDIISAEEGPICTVTTTTGQSVPPNMIAVKNYSENEGMIEWLYNEGIIDRIAYFLESGYVTIPVCELTEKGLNIFYGEGK